MEKSYPKKMSKNAGLAAGRAWRGEASQALARARDAAGERQLLHPDAWRLWAKSSDELFLQALSMASQEELSMTQSALLIEGGDKSSWVQAFARSPVKLAGLMDRGLDASNARCWIDKVEAHPAIYCSYYGGMEELGGMMEAGIASPEALSQEAALRLDKSEPKTAAHLLARCEGRWSIFSAPPTQERVNQVAGWLFEGAGVHKRNAKGYDALKYAIRHGSSMMALASLAHGANPFAVDAKGVDAIELLRRALGESGMEAKIREHRLKGLEPTLLAVAEARKISGALSQSGESAGASRLRI